jgi:hypothetical protein
MIVPSRRPAPLSPMRTYSGRIATLQTRPGVAFLGAPPISIGPVADVRPDLRRVYHFAADDIRRPDECRRENTLRLVIQFERRSELLDRAVIHQTDAIGQRERFLLIVSHENDRRAGLPVDPLDLDLHGLAELAVERRERFIHQDQRRLIDKASSQRDALLLAARQFVRKALAELFKPDHVERTGNLRCGHPVRLPAHLQRKCDVLLHRQMREERVVLKHDADIALVGLQIGLIAAVDDQPTAARLHEARDELQQRRLAGARRSKKCEQFAGEDFKFDRIQRCRGIVEFADTLSMQLYCIARRG